MYIMDGAARPLQETVATGLTERIGRARLLDPGQTRRGSFPL